MSNSSLKTISLPPLWCYYSCKKFYTQGTWSFTRYCYLSIRHIITNYDKSLGKTIHLEVILSMSMLICVLSSRYIVVAIGLKFTYKRRAFLYHVTLKRKDLKGRSKLKIFDLTISTITMCRSKWYIFNISKTIVYTSFSDNSFYICKKATHSFLIRFADRRIKNN